MPFIFTSFLTVYLIICSVLSLLSIWYVWGDIQKKLIELSLACGAVGSIIHALTSLARFLGHGKLFKSWFLWYLVRPIIGCMFGLIFYFVLRAGLATGNTEINPFGVAAVSCFAGMFSKQATEKLRELFDTFVNAK